MNPSPMNSSQLRDVQIGFELPPLILPAINRTTLALYAGASGDHNQVHIDLDFARKSRQPDVFAHGMLSAGLPRPLADRLGTATADPQPGGAIHRHYPTRSHPHVSRQGRRTVRGRWRTTRAPGDPLRQSIRRRETRRRSHRGTHLNPTRTRNIPMKKLEGKVALVTGSGRGIGAQCRPEAGRRRRARRGQRPGRRPGRRSGR